MKTTVEGTREGCPPACNDQSRRQGGTVGGAVTMAANS